MKGCGEGKGKKGRRKESLEEKGGKKNGLTSLLFLCGPTPSRTARLRKRGKRGGPLRGGGKGKENGSGGEKHHQIVFFFYIRSLVKRKRGAEGKGEGK